MDTFKVFTINWSSSWKAISFLGKSNFNQFIATKQFDFSFQGFMNCTKFHTWCDIAESVFDLLGGDYLLCRKYSLVECKLRQLYLSRNHLYHYFKLCRLEKATSKYTFSWFFFVSKSSPNKYRHYELKEPGSIFAGSLVNYYQINNKKMLKKILYSYWHLYRTQG